MIIYDALAERLMNGQLKPGDPIVIEQVADELGVSPTPVRESLARLAEQGVITRGQNGRHSVLRINPDHVRDVYMVRGTLEGLAAELAAPRLTPQDIETLRIALADMLAMVDQGDYPQYIAAADDIFAVILNAADSPNLTRELAVLRLHTGFVRSLTRRFIKDYVQVIHDELEAVVDALAAADGAGARQAMEIYLRNSGQRVAHLLPLVDPDG
jgi:DNA-binding GntR family transcriptional regulator